ncbi:MAG: hypothetical protein ACYTGL_08255 [Planctomycetota bacterium]|jgi:hypothetical protein
MATITEAHPASRHSSLTAQVHSSQAAVSNRSTTAPILMAMLLGACFVLLNLRPLWHTDIWGHLSYGRLIWSQGAIPASEPIMPLSEGMRFVDTAWLWQLAALAMWTLAGKAGLSFLYAASITAGLAAIAKASCSRSQSTVAGVTALILSGWVCWTHIGAIRPQNAGFLMFAVLLSVVFRSTKQRSDWLLIPLLFAAWANLHGSFAVGIAVLGMMAVGRACDLVRRSGALRMLLRDRQLRRWLLLTELAAAATLLNPYGLSLYSSIMSFGTNPNLASIVEWKPLRMEMAQGQAAAAVTALLFVLYRITPRRVTASEPLLLIVLGVAALTTSRMILWWGPVAGCVAALHLTAWLRKHRSHLHWAPQRSKSSLLAIAVSFIIAVLCFEVSHLGGVCLARAMGKDASARADRVPVNALTPVGAAAYLRDNPPDGLIFNPYEWGDYLVWAGPSDLKVFVASHAHLIPQHVWDDYFEIGQMGRGWDSGLEMYGIDTVVLDRSRQSELTEHLLLHDDWQTRYVDTQAAVFTRAATESGRRSAATQTGH